MRRAGRRLGGYTVASVSAVAASGFIGARRGRQKRESWAASHPAAHPLGFARRHRPMPPPQLPALALESVEDRALPSGGFEHPAPVPRAGWDATPAVTREYHSDMHHADGPGRHGFGGGEFERQSPAGAPVVEVEVVTVRTAAVRVPSVNGNGAAVASATALPAELTAPAEGPPATGTQANAPDPAPPPEHAAAVPTNQQAAPAASFSTYAAAPLSVNSSAAELSPTPVAPPPSEVVPLAPHPPATTPGDWREIVAELAAGVPVAGLLGVDPAALEGGVQRLLDLTTGIDVDGGGSGWELWLAAGAALGGAAGYAAWSSRTRSPRTAPLPGAGRRGEPV